jgi:ABC-type branched-subunit amino acid transport system substrate-binding protein
MRVPKMGRSIRTVLIALAIASVAIIPGYSKVINREAASGPVTGPSTGGPATGPSSGPNDSGPKAGGPLPPVSGLQCTRSKNGGHTDVGVTADKIKLASTVVQSGTGASFLSASPTGMQAVVRKINRAGGICGRFLDLTLVDDGWDGPTGLQDIKNFIKEDYFALPVVPSSEGLTAAIEAGEIEKAGIPVVGTDGMLKQQYDTTLSHWVYPVATATVSTMRIMAKHGYAKGARCFGIVWDRYYKFGKEGEDAFRKFVTSQTGAKMCADVGIYPARASYSSEIQQFNSACGGKCDFVAMLLEPQTALTWIAGRPQFGTLMTSGAQTLFNEQFAANCGDPCAGMLVWTGYNPPIGNLAGLADVGSYVTDVKQIDPTVDTTNQFLEGAYLGMTIFVEALKRVGPGLTRARLQQTLNTMCFTNQIASKLCWSATQRHANHSAQAFSISVAQGAFAGFKNEQTGFITDPSLNG